MDKLFPQGREFPLRHSFKMGLDLWESMEKAVLLFSIFYFYEEEEDFQSKSIFKTKSL